MREEFLHFVWRHKLFDMINLATVDGAAVQVFSVGYYTGLAGPDFVQAKMYIGKQLWYGSVELHTKASDWYVHRHELDPHYNNVILHVVWEFDLPIFTSKNACIPTVVLSGFVQTDLILRYEHLLAQKTHINCFNLIDLVPQYHVSLWKERLIVERLNQKLVFFTELLKHTVNHWELVCMYALAKGFGLNQNGALFVEMIQKIPTSYLLQAQRDPLDLEAVFYGLLGMLPYDVPDAYCRTLVHKYQDFQNKYQLTAVFDRVHFAKLRPENFPTIRLSQLAHLLCEKPQLFSQIIRFQSVGDLKDLLLVAAHPYWNTHYVFGVEGRERKKITSAKFRDLLLINVLLPMKFAYSKSIGDLVVDDYIELLEGLPAEQHQAAVMFKELGQEVESAFDSQAFLFLKKMYCDTNNCLNCHIGNYILRTDGNDNKY